MASRPPRYRNFTFLLYPDSAPENWREILEEEFTPMYVSLHNKDKDLGHDEEDRKDHYHILVMYDSPKAPDCLDELIEKVNGVKPPLHIFVVKNLRTMARYLTHMDQTEEKYPYCYDPEHKVIELGGAIPYNELCKSNSDSKAERLQMTKDIIDYARKHHITSFSQMCTHCTDNDLDEWLDLLMWQNSFGFTSFFKNSNYIDGFDADVKEIVTARIKQQQKDED